MFGTKTADPRINWSGKRVVAPAGIPLVEIVVTKEEAERQYNLYKDAPSTSTALIVRDDIEVRDYEKADSKLAEVFLALSQGAKVINLQDTFKQVGQDAKFRPKLGIAKASWNKTYCHREENGTLTFGGGMGRYSDLAVPRIFFESHTLPNLPTNRSSFIAWAPTPIIPKGLRPDNLDAYSVLWEPVWTGEAPPKVIDPILLMHLSGSLYKVIAAWDMTQIEAQILRGL